MSLILFHNAVVCSCVRQWEVNVTVWSCHGWVSIEPELLGLLSEVYKIQYLKQNNNNNKMWVIGLALNEFIWIYLRGNELAMITFTTHYFCETKEVILFWITNIMYDVHVVFFPDLVIGWVLVLKLSIFYLNPFRPNWYCLHVEFCIVWADCIFIFILH